MNDLSIYFLNEFYMITILMFFKAKSLVHNHKRRSLGGRQIPGASQYEWRLLYFWASIFVSKIPFLQLFSTWHKLQKLSLKLEKKVWNWYILLFFRNSQEDYEWRNDLVKCFKKSKSLNLDLMSNILFRLRINWYNKMEKPPKSFYVNKLLQNLMHFTWLFH